MNIWHTSDTHFGHARIIELCDRPFKSVDHMNETIIANWNAVIDVDDHVFHHGDVALGTIDESLALVGRLNGHKHLIIGNHDRVFGDRKPAYIERWTEEYGKYFETITESGQITINDVVFNMSHFPYDGDSHGGDRYREFRIADDGLPLIHGHTHGHTTLSRSRGGSVQIHVGVDAHEFTPVSQAQVWEYYQTALEHPDIEGV